MYGEGDDGRQVVQPCRQVGEEADRGQVGPVQVVQYDKEGISCGDIADQPEQRVDDRIVAARTGRLLKGRHLTATQEGRCGGGRVAGEAVEKLADTAPGVLDL